MSEYVSEWVYVLTGSLFCFPLISSCPTSSSSCSLTPAPHFLPFLPNPLPSSLTFRHLLRVLVWCAPLLLERGPRIALRVVINFSLIVAVNSLFSPSPHVHRRHLPVHWRPTRSYFCQPSSQYNELHKEEGRKEGMAACLAVGWHIRTIFDPSIRSFTLTTVTPYLLTPPLKRANGRYSFWCFYFYPLCHIVRIVSNLLDNSMHFWSTIRGSILEKSKNDTHSLTQTKLSLSLSFSLSLTSHSSSLSRLVKKEVERRTQSRVANQEQAKPVSHLLTIRCTSILSDPISPWRM